MKIIITILIAVFSIISLSATIINVPADYATIQAAINASVTSDTVLVQPGTYFEDVDFNGRAITVASLFLTTGDETYIEQTIINAGGYGHCVTFNSGESSDSSLLGFTVTDGAEGIYIEDSSPKIGECHIIGNTNGGVYCLNSFSELSDCVISENTAMWAGGGIYNENSDTNIINCTIRHINYSITV